MTDCINHRSVSYLLPPIALRLHARRQRQVDARGRRIFSLKVVLDKLLGNNLFLISAFLSHDD